MRTLWRKKAHLSVTPVGAHPRVSRPAVICTRARRTRPGCPLPSLGPGLLRPDLAPAARGHALACEDIAAPAGIARLALELRAGAALLARLVGCIRGRIDLGGIGHKTQGLRGGILRIERREPGGGRGVGHEAHGRNESAGDESALDDSSS